MHNLPVLSSDLREGKRLPTIHVARGARFLFPPLTPLPLQTAPLFHPPGSEELVWPPHPNSELISPGASERPLAYIAGFISDMSIVFYF